MFPHALHGDFPILVIMIHGSLVRRLDSVENRDKLEK